MGLAIFSKRDNSMGSAFYCIFKTASYDNYTLNNQSIYYLNLIDGTKQASSDFSSRNVSSDEQLFG
jgi:hypothetical protein